VEGARKLLEAASLLTPFPRVLLISTGYVYGNTDPDQPAREEDPIGPLWRYGPYTDSKIEMEAVARNYRGFVLTARSFAHIGPGQTPNFAIASFARQLANIERGAAKPIIRVGNLSAKRDLLDVRDVVRAYSLLLNEGTAGEVYNVASGKPTAIGDVLDHLRRLCRVSTTVEIDPERLRPADIACSTGDPLKLWTTTNWHPRYSLDTTLNDTLDYWRSLAAEG
jgi:GDP-4-dehydro-6-deoxy-D-mannose reductase